jgi:hypothetical protein
MAVRIDDLDIDEWNEAEMAAHHVTAREVRQVLNNEPVFLPNKKRHPAPLVMTGPTLGGRFLTVPIARTEVAGIWRPATAWDSNDDQLARYHANHGGRHR